jgi:hypothetical protein
MTADDIKSAVEKQVHALWRDFESQHPGLAAELERGDYIGAAMDVLRSDPAFKAALAKGTLADAATTSVLGVIEKVVRSLMRV